ncbi:ATP-dependent helicase HrpB [Desulfatitalea tepidiphila]|uniref:ATP-dependent helicase HrpB n=1 Tax=Desulfatitalea tepidiphila TaxID=1185843 RepID=UPI0006B69790|nr:ATP-dependent helicase HrpB [Desulfatitalea tepidiphila]
MHSDQTPALFRRLPVAAVLEELQSTLQHHLSAVLVAPPGAGKTTAVPLALLPAPWLAGRRILVLAPRRLAARAAAERMAALRNEAVGETVGYRIRMESRVGPRTRIEVVTEGVLIRRLQSDPGLADVGLVIFDEFHERSLEADLGLALCREVQAAFNEHLRLLVMSATLDPSPVATLLGNAPLIRCDGRAFPVETHHVPPRPTLPIERAVADTILRSVAACEGNILVFLPGAPEIRRVARLLADAGLPEQWDVAPLFGNLTRAEQDAAITPAPAGRNKIVLATAIAETSLTIEQIRVVVDSGLQRAPRFDPRSGMTRLVTLPVSQASADQRRGRAGRLGPGICYRLWNESTHAALSSHNRPEILDVDLTNLALELALWGVSSPDALGWLDPPPAGVYAQAVSLLGDLGAIDEQGQITEHGRRMADLPLHPRLAHMVLCARDAGWGIAACRVAALLSERDPLHFSGTARDTDLRLRLDALHAAQTRTPFHLSDGHVDGKAMGRVLSVASLLQRRLGIITRSTAPGDPGRLLAWAYPDRIASRRAEGVGRYQLTSGHGAYFDPPDPLMGHDLLVIAELDGERRDARIFLAAAYDRETLMSQFQDRLQWRETIDWDDQRQGLIARRRLMLGALVLQSEPLARPDPQALTAAMLAAIRKLGIGVLPWTPAVRTWQARVELLRRIETETAEDAWPDLSDAALADDLENWLAPYLNGITNLKDLARLDLSAVLRSRLTWQQRQSLDALAPTHIVVPSGRRRPIDYGSDPPVLAVRLQEMFGAAETPAIADGRLTLQLHLLSPAGRPAQITRDLAGFWRSSYASVKKELKGRYPKHHWPDDPLSARPSDRARPRKRPQG